MDAEIVAAEVQDSVEFGIKRYHDPARLRHAGSQGTDLSYPGAVLAPGQGRPGPPVFGQAPSFMDAILKTYYITGLNCVMWAVSYTHLTLPTILRV